MGNKIVVFILALLLTPFVSEGQMAAADSTKQRKNIVRVSLTHPLLFGSSNLIFGYERVIKPYQSMSLNVGLTSMPKLISVDLDSSFNITKDSKASGYNLSLDYRFYLQKENKFRAPRGIYIGPYAYLYTLDRNTDWSFQEDAVVKDFSTSQKLRIYGAGVELGYQFILWKRLAIDLVMIGPGLSRYSFEAKLDGELDLDEKQEALDALKAWVDAKYPGMDIVWGDKTVNADGRVNSTNFGYRYLIQVGFLF